MVLLSLQQHWSYTLFLSPSLLCFLDVQMAGVSELHALTIINSLEEKNSLHAQLATSLRHAKFGQFTQHFIGSNTLHTLFGYFAKASFTKS